MTELNLNNSSLRICVDRVTHRAASGRVFAQRLTEPIIFEDMSSLAFALERLFDEQDLPQVFQRTRTFLREEQTLSFGCTDQQEGMSEEMVSAQRGAILTLELLVLSRRSSTWQGEVDWLDGSERQKFSGYLELLHLVDQKVRER